MTYASKGDHFYIDEFPKKHWRVTKNAGDNTTITCDPSGTEIEDGTKLTIKIIFTGSKTSAFGSERKWTYSVLMSKKEFETGSVSVEKGSWGNAKTETKTIEIPNVSGDVEITTNMTTSS